MARIRKFPGTLSFHFYDRFPNKNKISAITFGSAPFHFAAISSPLDGVKFELGHRGYSISHEPQMMFKPSSDTKQEEQ